MMMGKRILVITVSALCLNPLAMAKDYNAEKNEDVAIGLGAGVVIGAVVGGPVGAGLAGIFGAILGENHAGKEQLKVTQSELKARESALSATQSELVAMQESMMALQQQASIIPVTHLTFPEQQVMAMESTIQFKTGSGDIEALYEEQLDLIAKALRAYPALAVRLTGYADYRGDTDANQLLSEQRAAAVKQALTERGVDGEQITLLAVGAASSVKSSPENTFFDRKVVLQILPEQTSITARR